MNLLIEIGMRPEAIEMVPLVTQLAKILNVGVRLCVTARIVGTNRQCVVAQVRDFLPGSIRYTAMTNALDPYGKGTAVNAITQALPANRNNFLDLATQNEFLKAA